MKRLFKFIGYYYNNTLVALGLRIPVIYTKHESYSLGVFINAKQQLIHAQANAINPKGKFKILK